VLGDEPGRVGAKSRDAENWLRPEEKPAKKKGIWGGGGGGKKLSSAGVWEKVPPLSLTDGISSKRGKKEKKKGAW